MIGITHDTSDTTARLMTPRAFSVQLKEGVTPEAFAAALLPKLADRAEWVYGDAAWSFTVEPADETGGCRVAKVNPRVTARITVSFANLDAAAKYAAFSASHFARIADAAFSAGAGVIGA